jgi:hypothetical protein
MSIRVATMRLLSFFFFVAAIYHCSGCQGVTNHVKQSYNSVAEDYHRVTTGSSSSYIASQRSQP